MKKKTITIGRHRDVIREMRASYQRSINALDAQCNNLTGQVHQLDSQMHKYRDLALRQNQQLGALRLSLDEARRALTAKRKTRRRKGRR